MRLKFTGWLFFVWAAFGAAGSLSAQGTAFTYQGQLNDGGAPANGSYDLSFTLYASTNVASPVAAAPITNSAVMVTNGLFTTLLNFGPGIFTGANYWLQMAVRTNGAGTFATLTPRQPLTPVPYAIFANSASNLLGMLSATQLSGTLPSAQIIGTYSSPVTFSNNANSFNGAFSGAFNGSYNGTFSGNGASLNSLNASQLTAGTVADARLTANVGLLNASQTFSGVNTFGNSGNSFSGSFFGNGLVGWVAVSGTTQSAARDTGYMLASSLFTTVTLPPTAGLTAGDIVRISGTGAGGWQVKENSSQLITGNFAAYRNGYLALLTAGTDYHGVAASADGVRMYAVSGSGIGVYGSSDSGQSWTQVSSTGATGLAGNYFSVACSANGKTVYAEPYAGGIIQKSTNYGVNWAATASSATGTFISCSADGSTLFPNNYACSGNGTYLAKVAGGVITISTNAGSSFAVTVTAPAAGVTCLGVSSDCTRLVAGVNGGLLYVSANRGATWTTLTSTSQAWSGAWMSPDGSKFAATVSLVGSTSGGIYDCDVSVLPNTSSTASTGSLTGSQGSAVELQYIGNNQFMPVSSTGIIWAN